MDIRSSTIHSWQPSIYLDNTLEKLATLHIPRRHFRKRESWSIILDTYTARYIAGRHDNFSLNLPIAPVQVPFHI